MSLFLSISSLADVLPLELNASCYSFELATSIVYFYWADAEKNYVPFVSMCFDKVLSAIRLASTVTAIFWILMTKSEQEKSSENLFSMALWGPVVILAGEEFWRMFGKGITSYADSMLLFIGTLKIFILAQGIVLLTLKFEVEDKCALEVLYWTGIMIFVLILLILLLFLDLLFGLILNALQKKLQRSTITTQKNIFLIIILVSSTLLLLLGILFCYAMKFSGTDKRRSKSYVSLFFILSCSLASVYISILYCSRSCFT